MYTTMIASPFLAVLLFSVSVLGHMEMTFPPPFRSKYNHFVPEALVQYNMTSPLQSASDGPQANFPCRNLLVDLGTAAGTSVMTWTQGSSVNFTLAGSAVHAGGTCQAALSNDAGKSWYVVKTYYGCPLAAGNFQLDIPSDTPTGASVFAWTWYNNIGNREIYMNCASITIAAGSGPAPKVAFSARPDLFVANVGNGCTTAETFDVLIPNPGPDVVQLGTAKQAAPSGVCSSANGIGGRKSPSSGALDPGSSNSGASSAVAPVVSSATPSSSSILSIQILPTTTSITSVFVTSMVSSSAIATSAIATSVYASSTGTASGPQSTGGSTSGLTPTVDGQCSGSQTCSGQSEYGPCCSQWGWCGNDADHCGTGCMAGFGSCGLNATSLSTGLRPRHVRQFKI
ncbi:related to spore coat protein SP96 precursor [Phialocephala subalpina]|uniref:Related to spore coat protein SP96 n=1 Tax=Phialocephala subalpina TaxID=576137 RepID=A0A1L7WHL0_9HELO|nr:related to spore coat protein SP96 precursor [Phialocephala subalpina]